MTTSPSSPTQELVEESDWSDEKLRKALDDYLLLKTEGNDYFTQKNWANAIIAYQQALDALPEPPKSPEKIDKAAGGEPHESKNTDDQINPDSSAKSQAKDASSPANQDVPHDKSIEETLSPLLRECAIARAVLHCNTSQCHIKLEAWEDAVKSATRALNEEPEPACKHKALWRRAQANERLDSWSSLTSAQSDYKTLVDIVPQSNNLHWEAKNALKVIDPKVEIAKEKDIAKMKDQLKSVGDSVLGWFGLSTNNFKMEPNGQGGYSLNFVK